MFLAPACAALDEPLETDDAPQTEEATRTRWPSWGAGTNSATVGDGLLFDELDSSGRPNSSGLWIDHAYITRAGRRVPVAIAVRRHDLEAIDSYGTTYSGYALIGAVIVLKHELSGPYEIHITDFYAQDLQFWAGPPEIVPFYEMKARREADVQKPLEYVCRKELLTSEPVWGRAGHSALVFQGDYYDPIAKTVSAVPDSLPLDSDSRFNIACAGTAPAKMHLTRHTRAGGIDARGVLVYPTSVSHRQAMLKMFTADYCGTGTSFTIDGFPLTYSDGRTQFARWFDATGIEAVWKARGAVCLNAPRLGYWATRYIAAHCGTIPRCDSIPWIASGATLPYPYVTSKLLSP